MKNKQRKNSLFIIPNLKKVEGGPFSRISDFKKVFLKNNDLVIQKNKVLSALTSEKLNIVYVESATNRIGFSDFVALLILKIKCRKMIVFIRDIYIELFPEEYKGFRKTITLCFNKISNLFLTLISDQMAFPTELMGKTFFEKHPKYPQRPYFALPPATSSTEAGHYFELTEQKKGIMYLGGTHYANSGIGRFLEISKELEDRFNFFVLTPDEDLRERYTVPPNVAIMFVKRDDILDFIKENNIAVAYHTRPRNFYDDLTFPIKALDFLYFQIPFLSERHVPIEQLMGKEYELFVNWHDLNDIVKKTDNATFFRNKHLNELKRLADKNTYDKRYIEIISK